MDRFIPTHLSPSHEFEVADPSRVHALANSIAGGLRSEAIHLTAAPSSGVSWTHGGVSSNRLHTHLLQRELLGSNHLSSPLLSPSSAQAAGEGLLLARESDASHWSMGGPLDAARARDAAALAAAAVPGAVADPALRPRATGLAADARAAALQSSPLRHRVLHFGLPGRGHRTPSRGDADSSYEIRAGVESARQSFVDSDENLGRGGGGGAGLEWGAAAGSPASASRTSSVSSATDGSSSHSSSSTMSPLALAAVASAAIRSQGLTGLSAGSEELLRSPKRLYRKISRVPYKVVELEPARVSCATVVAFFPRSFRFHFCHRAFVGTRRTLTYG